MRVNVCVCVCVPHKQYSVMVVYFFLFLLIFFNVLGRRIKRKVEEYEYDEGAETLYRTSLLKQFNKTLTDGYFTMIIVDDINNKV